MCPLLDLVPLAGSDHAREHRRFGYLILPGRCGVRSHTRRERIVAPTVHTVELDAERRSHNADPGWPL
jgi:hypothetical protein